MIPLEAMQAQILATIQPLAPRPHPFREATGLVLAADVMAREPVPPFANTGMDGYAVRAEDTTTAPVRLRVVDELPAGKAPSRAVGAGEAIRIMTGAPIPVGADAIVMVEVTHAEGDEVVVLEHATCGDHIRPAGGDIESGQRVFSAGTVLTPAHIGVLASLDVTEVVCYPRPRVGVMSTGDELVESGVLPLGSIRDSNRPMLLATVAEAGFTAVDDGIARDDEQEIEDKITRAVAQCDALLTSGAVSMGDYDYVKIVLERLAKEHSEHAFTWAQVAIKPAKPLAYGTLDSTPVFGLPGNPVSSRVSFELFAPARVAEDDGSRRAAPPDRARDRPHGVQTSSRRQAPPRQGSARARGRRVCLREGGPPGEQRALRDGRIGRPRDDPGRSRGRGRRSRPRARARSVMS